MKFKASNQKKTFLSIFVNHLRYLRPDIYEEKALLNLINKEF